MSLRELLTGEKNTGRAVASHGLGTTFEQLLVHFERQDFPEAASYARAALAHHDVGAALVDYARQRAHEGEIHARASKLLEELSGTRPLSTADIITRTNARIAQIDALPGMQYMKGRKE